MTQSTEAGRRHWLDGWMPRVVLGLALFLALAPTVPFAGRLPAVLVIGVFSYQLGQRKVQREVEAAVAATDPYTAEQRAIGYPAPEPELMIRTPDGGLVPFRSLAQFPDRTVRLRPRRTPDVLGQSGTDRYAERCSE